MAIAAASDSTAVCRSFSNFASAASFRAACSANHVVALRVALDNAENRSVERALAVLRLRVRERVGGEMVVTGGGGGSGKGKTEDVEDVAGVKVGEVAWVKVEEVAGVKVEEEGAVKERYEEMGWGGGGPVTQDGELLAGTCVTLRSTRSPGGGGSGRESMSEGSTSYALMER